MKRLSLLTPLAIVATLGFAPACSRTPTIYEDPAKVSFVTDAPDQATADLLRVFTRSLLNQQVTRQPLRLNLVRRLEALDGKRSNQEVLAERDFILPLPPEREQKNAIEKGRPGFVALPEIRGAAGEEYVLLRWVPVSQLPSVFVARPRN